MTKLSSPATSDYNFQLTESQNADNLTLKSILQNADNMDMVDVMAKVVYKDNDLQIVGAPKLKKSNCYIVSKTARLPGLNWSYGKTTSKK